MQYRIIKKNCYITAQRVFGKSLTEFFYIQYKKAEFLMGKQLPNKEKNIIKAISPHITKMDTVIDIGAFIGAWSKILSKMVGPRGKVISFEPMPYTYRVLCELCENYKNIITYNLALSNKNCVVKMVAPKEERLSSLPAIAFTASQLKNKNLWRVIECNARCLDDILYEIGTPRITFIKCDVEGHELQVMKGARKTLIDQKPVIVLEILIEKWKDNNPLLSDIAIYLTELGYEMGQFVDDKIVYGNIFQSESEDFIFRPLSPNLLNRGVGSSRKQV